MNRHQRRAQKAAFPKGYSECGQKMNAAAKAFMAARPGFTPRFNGFPPYILAKIPASASEDEVSLAASLPACMGWWPADDETRAMLEEMDIAGNRQGSYMQAKAAIAVALEDLAATPKGQA